MTGCNYEGYDFGGGYIDSICIDGYLWDLDSCDEPGGALSHGGEWACPCCNTKQFLEDALRNAKEDVWGSDMGTPWCGAVIWENSLKKAYAHNPEFVKQWISTVEPFTVFDWPDRKAVYDGKARCDHVVEVTADLRLTTFQPVSQGRGV